MTRDYFIRLYDYHAWANRKVWDCVLQLSDEQFTQDLAYSRGSLRDQVFHTMTTEHMYLSFIVTGDVEWFEAGDYPDRAALRRQWEAVEANSRAYVAAVTPDELARLLKWGDRPPIYVWEALTQVVLHSMDHRAQILNGLHQLGAPTVEQDFIYHALESRA